MKVENNSIVGPQNLSLDVSSSDDGIPSVFLTVTDEDSAETVLELYMEDPEEVDLLIGALKTAVEETF